MLKIYHSLLLGIMMWFLHKRIVSFVRGMFVDCDWLIDLFKSMLGMLRLGILILSRPLLVEVELPDGMQFDLIRFEFFVILFGFLIHFISFYTIF